MFNCKFRQKHRTEWRVQKYKSKWSLLESTIVLFTVPACLGFSDKFIRVCDQAYDISGRRARLGLAIFCAIVPCPGPFEIFWRVR